MERSVCELMMWQQSQTPVDTGTSFHLSQLEVLEALGVPAVLFAMLLFLCGTTRTKWLVTLLIKPHDN